MGALMAVDVAYAAKLVGMVTPDTFFDAVGRDMGRFNRLHKRASTAAVRLTPKPQWAVYGDGNDSIRREHAIRDWARRAVVIRDEFGRRASRKTDG